MNLLPSFSLNSYILFEDDAILMINKPCGLMVEPDRNQNPCLLHEVKNYLNSSSPQHTYAQHIHRLDRPVSGIVLFVKNKIYLHHLSNQFAERTIKKKYQALSTIFPAIDNQTLTQWHRKEKKKARIESAPFDYAEQVQLSYKIASFHNYCLWDIDLHTGKFHQIRAQLASIGSPILGDFAYGSTNEYQKNSIALHACSLTFKHPITNEELIIYSEPDWKIN